MSSTLDTILLPTLERIRSLYASTAGAHASRRRALVVKPGPNVVLGAEGRHGAAMNFGDREDSSLDVDKVPSWVGTPLPEVTQLALRCAGWHERSVGVAVLSALSQPFLAPEALAVHGIELRGARRFRQVGQQPPRSLPRATRHGSPATGRFPGDGDQRHHHLTSSPDWVRVDGPEDNPEVLRRADAVAMTGSALVNGTIADLLDH